MILCSVFAIHCTAKYSHTYKMQSNNATSVWQLCSHLVVLSFLSVRNGGNLQLNEKTDIILWLLRRVSVSSVIQYVQLLISLILCAVFIIWRKKSAGSLGSVLQFIWVHNVPAYISGNMEKTNRLCTHGPDIPDSELHLILHFSDHDGNPWVL
jgi:hypothetical protein